MEHSSRSNALVTKSMTIIEISDSHYQQQALHITHSCLCDLLQQLCLYHYKHTLYFSKASNWLRVSKEQEFSDSLQSFETTNIHWVRHGLSCWNILYVDFSDCLFLLNNIYLKFLRVFLGPSVFIFVILNCSRYPMCPLVCFASWLNLRIWDAMNVYVFSGNEIVSHLAKYQGI